MTTIYRVEMMFSGPVPEDEMERARILANPEVMEAHAALEGALGRAGLAGIRAETRVVRSGGKRPRLTLAAE